MRRESHRLLLAHAALWLGACGVAVAQAAPVAPIPGESVAPGQLDVLEFVVDGNSVLSEVAIGETLEPYLGPERTPEDVDRAREALEHAYHEAGYKTVAVAIPKQTVREGSVRLQVTEGRVARLAVVGSRYHSYDRIREQAPSMAEGRVPDFDELKQDVMALNQLPDRRVTPSLKAGKVPGTVDIDLAVSDDLPLHGTAELNNRNSQGTSELRSQATISYANLWQRGHSFSASYQTAPQEPDESRVVFGSYLARFHARPFSLLFSALQSDSDVATVGGINVVGKGRTAGVRGLWTLPGTETYYQSFSAGVDYKRYLISVQLDDGALETPLEYYPISFGYTGLLSGEGSSLDADLRVSFASKEIGSGFDDLDKNRTFTRGQQFAVRGGVGYTRTLPLRLEAHVHVDGQWTDQPLVTNEQFAIGGADSVRGLFEAEALGDYGAGYGVELRAPSLSTPWMEQLQGFIFVDGGAVWRRDPTPDVPDHNRFASTGAGFSVKLLSHLNGNVDWAYVLDGGPATSRNSTRVLFRVWGSF